MAGTLMGYAGKLLRVDLTNEVLHTEELDAATLRQWVGGSGLGAKLLYDEVPPEVGWSDPANRLIFASGPLAGTVVTGSGTFSAVTKGAMTNGATTTQANGFLGAYMKFAGFDGVVVHGRAPRWAYLYLHDGRAELRDAAHLVGKDTWEIHDLIAAELGKPEKAISVFGVGPAGENLVRYAGIVGDHGHVAGHNGSGAVMGSKLLKAIVAERGGSRVQVRDPQGLRQAADAIIESVMSSPVSANTYHWGTSMVYSTAALGGWLPIKNYTTSVFPEHDRFMGENYRPRFEIKRSPCFACRTKHLHLVKITDGPYAGFVGEEPEYEQFAAWGALIGQTDVAAAVVIANEVDRLGFENNEIGWVVAWAIECYEKGLLTREDTDGLELTWGNVESVRTLLRKIAHREGAFANLLADGVKQAAERVGRGTDQLAVYTGKGNSPRGHDHRGRWMEMVETVVSSTGTLEVAPPVYPDELGAPAKPDPFSPDDVGELLGKTNGRMFFEDSLGTCRFTTRTKLQQVVDAVNAATGWDMTLDEAMKVGRRTSTLLRAFNLRHGISAEVEYPSERYSSTPVDGPVAGKSIRPHWQQIVTTYFDLMGWDTGSGRPLPETLRSLGLGHIAPDLWPAGPGR